MTTTPHDTNLDWDPEAFERHLHQACELVLRLYQGLDEVRITPAAARREIASLFDQPLPEQGQNMEEVLREVERNVLPSSTLGLSPRFFGYINGGGNQAAIVAELLATALNQICAKWQFGPCATEIERRVIRWIAEFLDFPAAAGGCLLSGGSTGNLVGLALARTRRAPFDAATLGQRGGPPLTVYVSQEGHASIEKSLVLLGMGRESLRKIPVREDFTVDLDLLAAAIEADRRAGCHPLCVVGNAGTTNTGAVDPLDALAELCERHGLWFHVDAAYGGPAAATAQAGALFRGLSRADSLVVNPHKWLFQPVEVACILVREPAALRDTFRIAADYLREEGDLESEGSLDFKDYGPQLSRSFRALKVWMTLKAYGARRLREAIGSDIEIMQHLARRIDESQDFVRLAPVPLSAVCFQYRTPDASLHENLELLNTLNDRLEEAVARDGRVFVSGTWLHGRRVLRACSVNHRLRREDVELLLAVVREIGLRLSSGLPGGPS